MYIGIYITDSHISAAMQNQDEEVVLVKDVSVPAVNKSVTPLKIYIEDNFAYAGTLVENLIANDYNLPAAKNLLDGLEQPETTIYTDISGVRWNASGLLSIFLKKLKSDILVQNDRVIEGAMVTTTRPVTPTLIKAMEQAFEMADLPFCGMVDMGKAALHGYGMMKSKSKERKIVLLHMDATTLTINIVKVDNENFSETLLLASDKNLGQNMLIDLLMDFLATRYRQMTGKEIKKNAKNAIHLKKLAIETLNRYFSQSELYIRTVYSSTEPTIELILTRAQLNAIVSKFMDQSIEFLKNTLLTTHIEAGAIDEVVLTGDSKILQMVPHRLQRLFDSKHIKVNSLNAGEIPTRGVTLLVNDAVEREISISLLAETDTDLTADKTLEPLGETGQLPDQSRMISLINSMQINRVGDM